VLPLDFYFNGDSIMTLLLLNCKYFMSALRDILSALRDIFTSPTVAKTVPTLTLFWRNLKSKLYHDVIPSGLAPVSKPFVSYEGPNLTSMA
jgi:hypothetical protein